MSHVFIGFVSLGGPVPDDIKQSLGTGLKQFEMVDERDRIHLVGQKGGLDVDTIDKEFSNTKAFG
jgi:hypothetical protein